LLLEQVHRLEDDGWLGTDTYLSILDPLEIGTRVGRLSRIVLGKVTDEDIRIEEWQRHYSFIRLSTSLAIASSTAARISSAVA
jgi:hypothetical protein